jgi:YkoY family integral membrane protein
MPGLVITDVPLIFWYVAVLVFLEGLLSADNALVLALMVRHLPKQDQRKVLQVGIWGAIGFRIIAVMLSAILMKFWIFKFLGGLYLLYLAASHFIRGDHSNDQQPSPDHKPRWSQTFWGTVTSVTLTDIAFSIDSILAAVAMAESFPERFGANGKLGIVFVGGVLGIITMRFVVRYFLVLLEKFPGLAQGAYFLVAWIGLKLLSSGLHDGEHIPFHMPEWLFWTGMATIGALSFLLGSRTPAERQSISESAELLE